VTFLIDGCPFLIIYTKSLSATISIAPVMAIIAPRSLESSLARVIAPSILSSVIDSISLASTPLHIVFFFPIVFISDILPFIT